MHYTLSSSGHILGIINPPVTPPKRSYWTGLCGEQSADEWKHHHTEVKGSWWEHWTKQLEEQCGPLVDARQPGSNSRYPELCAAPGRYVLDP